MDEAVAVTRAARSVGRMRRASPAERTRLSAATIGLMAAGAAVWTAAVGALAIWRHHQFLSHRFDLGNMVQAVWSTTQGRPLEMTDGTTGEQIVRLGAHVDPILVLFAPLWWISPRPETLILAYVGALAAGIYPVFRLALKHTESRLAAGLLGAWYFVFPWTIWIALNELNPSVLALPLLLYAIWYLDEHRLGYFVVFASLAVLTGELIGLTIAALGVWYAIQYRRPRVGIAIAIAGSAWTAFCLAVVIPAFNDGEPSRYYNRFESVGGSPLGVLETLLTDPGAIVDVVTTGGDFRYLLLMVLPTAFLLLVQPLLLLAAVPQLGVNLLSEFGATVSPLYHYSAPVIAIVITASIMGVGRLPARGRVAASGAVLGAGVMLLAVAYPSPGTEKYLFPELDPPSRLAAMRQAVELVPRSVPVTVTNRFGAKLSERRSVHLFPARADAEWAVLDTRDPPNDAWGIGPITFEQQLRRLDRDPSWRLRFQSEGVRVYEKRPSRRSSSSVRLLPLLSRRDSAEL